MFTFGAGVLFLQNARAGQYTRLGVAALQEGSLDISTEIKQLYGANRYPVATAQGKGKIAGTAKYADWRIDTVALLLGIKFESGSRLLKVRDAGSGPVTSGTVTVTPPNSGVFLPTGVDGASGDVQVVFAAQGTGTSPLAPGTVLTQVSGTPNPGEYSFVQSGSTGVYTFNAQEEGAEVLISYLYSLTTGYSLMDNNNLNQWSNIEMGSTAACRGIFRGMYGGRQVLVELEYVVPAAFKTASKLDDFWMNDTNFEAFANPDTDKIGQISMPD